MSTRPLVIYVEDNQFDVLMFKRVLSEYHLDIDLVVFSSGEALFNGLALDESLAGRTRLIVLDLNLPRLSGFDVLERFQDNELYSAIPVIVYTTSSLPAEKQKAREYTSVVAYLEKNSPEKLLVDRMQAVFTSRLNARKKQALPSTIRCLYVEDSREDAIALQRLCLSDYGVQLETVFSTDMANQQLGLKAFDCLILDQYLAGDTGLNYAQRLRVMDDHKNLPILMISNWPDEQLISKAKEIGVHHFISKDDLYQIELPELIRSAILNHKPATPDSNLAPGMLELPIPLQQQLLEYSVQIITDSQRGKRTHAISLRQLVSKLSSGLGPLLSESNSQLYFDRSKSIGIDSDVLYHLVQQIMTVFLRQIVDQVTASVTHGSSRISLSYYAVGMHRTRLNMVITPSVSLAHEAWLWFFNAHATIISGEVGISKQKLGDDDIERTLVQLDFSSVC